MNFMDMLNYSSKSPLETRCREIRNSQWWLKSFHWSLSIQYFIVLHAIVNPLIGRRKRSRVPQRDPASWNKSGLFLRNNTSGPPTHTYRHVHCTLGHTLNFKILVFSISFLCSSATQGIKPRTWIMAKQMFYHSTTSLSWNSKICC